MRKTQGWKVRIQKVLILFQPAECDCDSLYVTGWLKQLGLDLCFMVLNFPPLLKPIISRTINTSERIARC